MEFGDGPVTTARYIGFLNHTRRRHCNELITDNKDSNLLLSLKREMLLTHKLEIFIFIPAAAWIFSGFVISGTERIPYRAQDQLREELASRIPGMGRGLAEPLQYRGPLVHGQVTSLSLSLFIWRMQIPPPTPRPRAATTLRCRGASYPLSNWGSITWLLWPRFSYLEEGNNELFKGPAVAQTARRQPLRHTE